MNTQETSLIGFYGNQTKSEFVLEKHIDRIGERCFERYNSTIFDFEEGSALEVIDEMIAKGI